MTDIREKTAPGLYQVPAAAPSGMRGADAGIPLAPAVKM